MIAASFIFKHNNANGDFKALDDEIMLRAQANPGYLGKEKWLSPDQSQIRVIYYFENQAALAEFSRDELHLAAKARYTEWYDGFRVEIAEVVGNWGDGKIASPID